MAVFRSVNWPAVALVVGCATANSAHAGHGLMNSFADLVPLPPAGITPTSALWRIERLVDSAVVYLAAVPRAEMHYAERHARNRLAEFIATAQARDIDAAGRAAAAYREDMTSALDVLRVDGPLQNAHLGGRLATALLEHRYQLSLAYAELPIAARAPAEAVFDWMQARYDELRGRLSRGYVESLFFKEEEVRWSWEMALRADEVER